MGGERWANAADIVGEDDTVGVTKADSSSSKLPGGWPPVRFACVAITGPGEQGTGFFIDRERVLTAAHVIPDLASLEQHRLVWGKFVGSKPRRLTATGEAPVLSGSGLDYAVFSVEPYDWDISWLDVGSGAGAVVGERVTVYGHPAGGLLRKSGRSASEIVDVGRDGTLRYRADATGGASGGPVLSTKTGELLAVHLGGDPQREANRGLLISTILQEWQP